MTVKGSTKWLLLALAVGVSLYLLGYFTAKHRIFPHKYLSRLESAASSLAQPDGPAASGSNRSIETIFLNLNVDEIDVPVQRAGAGGGLTSVGDELLLITHEGRFFRVAENGVEETQIEAPVNGLSEYMAAARSEKYRDLQHNFDWFRYNDVLHYSEDGQAGLVVSYTEWLPDEECYGTSIAQLPLPLGTESIMDVVADQEDWRIVYRTRPCLELKSSWRAIEGHMAGGRIAYRPPLRVVLGSGDYHWDGLYAPVALAQEPGNDYGKVLEIDLGTGAGRTVSTGHRNMQGVVVDTDGQIWVTEHGPRGGDELNRVVDGGNFGWPDAVLGTRYNKLPWPGAKEYGRHDQHIPPTYAWVPSVATSGLTQIHGFAPSWDGDLLVSTFKGGLLFRLRVKENRVVFAEPVRVGGRIRYVHQHTDGRIVLWTDSRKLLFLSLGGRSHTEVLIENSIAGSDYSAQQKQRLRSALETCAECHSFEPANHEGAPGLGAIFGRQIATTSYEQYSDALRSKQGRWTTDQLIRFLRDPQEFAGGTSMPDPVIDDQYVIDGIVKILEELRNDAE